MKQFQMDGYVTAADISTRQTQSGKQVTTFSVNSPDRRKNAQGEWESVPQFFQCQYWHRADRDFRAAFIAPKAHLVMVGEPRFEEWEKDGQKRSRVILNVRDMWPIKERDEAPQQTRREQPEPDYLYDEELPF